MKIFELDIDTYENSQLLENSGVEANLWVNGDTVFKILRANYREKLREKCIEEMTELSHPNCVFPDAKLVWDDTKSFIGVKERYLKDYITLSKYLNNNKIDFKTRKQIAYKMCEIMDYLHSIDLRYIDIHASNVMTNGKDIQLIDMDAAEFKKYHAKSDYFDYMREDMICTYLSELCFSILLNHDLDVRSIVNDSDIVKLIKKSNKSPKDFIEKVFERKEELIRVSDYIDHFDEDYMEESRLILHI